MIENKNPTDLLFLYPYFDSQDFYFLKFNWSLGIGYILAYLKERNINGSYMIHKEPICLDRLIELILSCTPKIVGFSCYDVNYFFVKLIAKELKRRKDTMIIVGGPTATFSDNLILNDEDSIDICIRGEGEETVAEIYEYLEGRKNLSKIKGISYRIKNKVVRTQDRPLLKLDKEDEELDIFPSPFILGVLSSNIDDIGILSSRGCLYRCSYCNFSAISNWTIRYHSIDRVIDELKIISSLFLEGKLDSNVVQFYDNNFSLNIARTKKLVTRIIDEKLPLSFICATRPDCVDEELLVLMKKANFARIDFGLESASPENLRMIKKVVSQNYPSINYSKEINYLNRLKENVKRIKDLGMGSSVSFIIGLPGQNKQEAEQTIKFVDDLGVDMCMQNFLTLYPGTELFEKRKEFNLDVVRPATALPYKTKFLFDVSKVSLAKHSVNKQLIDIYTNIALDFFVRNRRISQSTSNFSTFLFDDYLPKIDNLKGEIRNNIVLSAIFLFIHNNSESLRLVLNSIIESGIPIINLLQLKKIFLNNSMPKVRIFELIAMSEVIARRRLDYEKIGLFLFLPLKSIYQNIRFDYQHHMKKIVIFNINTKSDKEVLNELLLDRLSLKCPLPDTEASFYLSGECRWLGQRCPIISENRLFINKRGKVSFCQSGEYFRDFICEDFKLPDLEKERELLFNNIEQKRNCKSCALNLYCSKCPFTFPFTEEEFCSLSRSGLVIRFIDELKKWNFFYSTLQRFRNKQEGDKCKILCH